MPSLSSPVFNVDVLDGSGNIIGPGPLENVLAVEITEELDRAGLVTVSIPATYQRAQDLLGAEKRLQVRVLNEDIVATCLIQNLNVVASGQQPIYQISGPDLLGELVYLNTGYNRTYDNRLIANVIIGTSATAASLLGGTGWTQGSIVIDPGVGTRSTISFDGQTRLQALITLAEQIGHHLRQGTTARTLDFGLFGADSGLRAMNVHHALVKQQEVSPGLAYIADAEIGKISAEIENRLYPLGKDRFDLQDASTSITDIKVAANTGPDGAETTLTAQANPTDTTLTVTSTTGFVANEYIWVGNKANWTANHEMLQIQSIGGPTTINLVSAVTVTLANGSNVIQRPQFYVEDTASQAALGGGASSIRENTPQFAWIGPIDPTSSTSRQQAADVLYHAAKARLLRYSLPYETYVLTRVLNLPTSLRVGDKIRVVYHGAVKAYGGSYYVDIDDDLFVTRITRTWQGNGEASASLAVSDVDRPTPNNSLLVIFNLDNLRWLIPG
jgi:hypothetical protein